MDRSDKEGLDDFEISAVELRRSFEGRETVHALDGVDLGVSQGEFLVLLGPSGCGKSTLLRCLAGLDNPTKGRISLGRELVYDSETGRSVPPHKRDYGMVFQSYALWPHLSVAKNVAFPLEALRVNRQTIDSRVAQVLETVRCGHLRDRLPAELSGGQQQRVALARALAASSRILLLDEPLSNLDALLRREMRVELASIHAETGFTGVYVTHDQTEAFNLGTRVAVMKAGKIVQLDTPENIYLRPQAEETAAFLGIRNQLDIEFRGGSWSWDGSVISLEPPAAGNGSYRLFLRPEILRLSSLGVELASPRGSSSATLGRGVVQQALFGGDRCDYIVRLGDKFVYSQSYGPIAAFSVGEQVQVEFDPTDALLYQEGLLTGSSSPGSRSRSPVINTRSGNEDHLLELANDPLEGQ